MKYIHILSTLLRRKVPFNRSFCSLNAVYSINVFTSAATKQIFTNKINIKFKHSDNEELYDNFSFEENEMEHTESRKNILLDYQDDIISKLNSCASVEEVLNVVLKYRNLYEDKHAVQTILILRHLQKIYYKYSGVSNDDKPTTFLESVSRNKGFDTLLRCIGDQIDQFNPEYLSYVLLYLNKFGIPVEDQLMQKISIRIRDRLLEEFSLAQCSRLLTVIFSENSVRPYYLSLSIIPLVASHIETCSSVEDLHNLTISLNKLHHIVNSELLEKYKAKVTEFLKNNKLKGTDYPTLLKIILFLNFPEWRDQCVLLTSECILLLKYEMDLLNIENLAVLYEIFFKNQEPGLILNSIQRCSAKFLHQLEETETDTLLRLKLFSSLIYFSSPTHRIRFRTHVSKYLENCNNYKAMIELRKIFSYVKLSDPKLCGDYWNLSLKLLNDTVNANIILKLCQNYINFNIGINNYRHYGFEARIVNYIKDYLPVDPFLNPARISGYLNFVILYGRDRDLIDLLLCKFEEHLPRIKVSHCLKISHSLLHLKNRKENFISEQQIEKIRTLLNRYTKELIENEENLSENNYLQNSMLAKALILRNGFDEETLEHLLTKHKQLDYMSSKIIENICYIFLTTASLVPEVVNKCTEYVIKNENNILGFNAEKLLYLCFYLAYYPINGDKFFQVITDVIIRDQERLSGLAFLQSALALCFFNKLPGSFIRQIFNVEFLEKLDVELENCYAKETYPQRVRKALMMLNRAVCLEYPEFNVPWFHKKYIEDMQKKSVEDSDGKFQQHIKDYLVKILEPQHYLSEHVLTPYGYHINFVVNLNSKGEAVPSDSPCINRRVALLLLRQHDYTRFYKHLKGKYQLKVRHLEIFGYEVAIVKFNEWINLLYGEERLEYLSKLIWPGDKKNAFDVSR